MAKIEMITLKDMEIREVDGEYEQHFFNEKRYPAAITNYSLNMGEKLGLVKGSQLTDLVKLANLGTLSREMENGSLTEESVIAAEGIDINKYLKTIYLSMIGLNKQLELSYEDFLEKYHEDTADTINTYTKLVLASVNIDKNKFAEGLDKSTSKK